MNTISCRLHLQSVYLATITACSAAMLPLILQPSAWLSNYAMNAVDVEQQDASTGRNAWALEVSGAC